MKLRDVSTRTSNLLKREASACQQELHQPSSQEYLTLAPRVSSQAWVPFVSESVMPFLCMRINPKMICGETGRERERGVSINYAVCYILATTRQFTLGQHSLVLSPWPSCSKYGSPFVRGHLQGWFPNDFDLVVLSTCLGEVQELHKRTLSLILVLWGSSAPASMSRYHLHLWHVHAPGLKT